MDDSICPSLELNAGDRAMLAGFLLESLELRTDDSVEAAWCEEIERRMPARDQGTVKTSMPADLLVVNDNP